MQASKIFLTDSRSSPVISSPPAGSYGNRGMRSEQVHLTPTATLSLSHSLTPSLSPSLPLLSSLSLTCSTSTGTHSLSRTILCLSLSLSPFSPCTHRLAG